MTCFFEKQVLNRTRSFEKAHILLQLLPNSMISLAVQNPTADFEIENKEEMKGREAIDESFEDVETFKARLGAWYEKVFKELNIRAALEDEVQTADNIQWYERQLMDRQDSAENWQRNWD